MSAASALGELIRQASAPLMVGEAALARLFNGGNELTVAKGEVVLRAGDVADRLIFVHQGLLRYYYIDIQTGDERTGQFFAEKSLVTDAASFLSQDPGLQTFEAIEPSRLFVLPRAVLLAAYDEDHAIERFGRKMIEAALVGVQRRAASLLNLSPDERYRRFVETRGEIARRVPQYLLASHLGVTPESLSRIRRRIARRTEAG